MTNSNLRMGRFNAPCNDLDIFSDLLLMINISRRRKTTLDLLCKIWYCVLSPTVSWMLHRKPLSSEQKFWEVVFVCRSAKTTIQKIVLFFLSNDSANWFVVSCFTVIKLIPRLHSLRPLPIFSNPRSSKVYFLWYLIQIFISTVSLFLWWFYILELGKCSVFMKCKTISLFFSPLWPQEHFSRHH